MESLLERQKSAVVHQGDEDISSRSSRELLRMISPGGSHFDANTRPCPTAYRLQSFYPFGVPQSHACRWPRFRFCSVHLNQSLQTAPEQTLWVNSSVQKPRTPSIPRSLCASQPMSGSPGSASSPVHLQSGCFSFHLHFFHPHPSHHLLLPNITAAS